MEILCPHCQFSKQVADEALPPLPSKVTCPQCSQSFTLEEPQETAAFSLADDDGPVTPPPLPTEASPSPEQPPVEISATDEQPAGFWVRVVAAIIDSALCNMLVFAMAFSLGMVLEITSYQLTPETNLLITAMGIIVTIFYYVFFTGYCGQTPGKMAMRIRVMHNDGYDVGYGQAFIREVIGKALSGILFCAGYLMVAMRSDKRGLHDLLSRTKVVKV